MHDVNEFENENSHEQKKAKAVTAKCQEWSLHVAAVSFSKFTEIIF
jgi:hypothetical protein